MTTPRRIHTDRLCLVPGTAELGCAEINDRTQFAALLGATVPPEWPPPLNDEGSMTWFTEYVESNPEAVGWAAWYFLLKAPDGSFAAVGNGGFKFVGDGLEEGAIMYQLDRGEQ